MTDEPQVPMNDHPEGDDAAKEAAEAPTWPGPAAGQAPPAWPEPPAWQAPPAWGSATQGWPPPPPRTFDAPAAPPTPPTSQGYGAPGFDSQGFGTPTPGYGTPLPGPGVGGPGGSGPGGAWNYGYTAPGWGPPPGASRPPNGARRAIAAVAVIALVLVSAGVGAAISAAVHSNNNASPTANSPIGNGNGNGNNGFSSGGNSSDSPTSRSLAAKVNPAVVDIYTTIKTGTSQGEAAGTGMIITSSGEVLTNNHVIDGASTIRVQLVGTGESHTAKVVGYDVVDDVALLKIDNVSGLDTVNIADISTVGIGDNVVAIGNAGGRGGTPAATSGSVTALDQKVTAGDVGSGNSETLHGMIQISAPIEPGDSGGPLVNTDGKVIGMNTAAAQSDDFFGQNGTSTAFAIPIDKAMQVVKQIEAGNDSDTVHVGDRGILGVQVRNVGANGLASPTATGAAIAGVQSGGPADSAGLSQNDVITSLDGKAVTNASDLTSLMFPYHPGDKVDVGWVDQNGQTHHDSLKLIPGPPS